MLNFTSDQWVIVALIFVLGLLVGGFLFSGGGRKWKHRYNSEVDRRSEIEKTHAQREKDWREQDSQRETALREAERQRAAATPVVAAPVVAAAPLATSDRRDVNNDGVVTPAERKPGIMDRMMGRDRDGDGTPDDRDPVDNRKL